MPGRHLPSRQEDPYRRIKNWDDGYDYIRADKPSFQTPSGSEPRRKPSRRDPVRPTRHAYPSPPSDSGSERSTRRRRQPRDYSPPRHRPARSPSPLRQRDSRRDHDDRDAPHYRHRRPSLEARATAPQFRSRDLRDTSPRRRSLTRSPSPRRRRDQPHRRHRSPSPPRDSRHRRDRGHEDDFEDHRHHRSPEATTPLPPRPPIGRSHTTSAKDRFASLAHLSPHWQKAATSALQAGGLAALNNMRSQPGGWNAEKGARIATAALGAAALEAFARGKNNKDEADGSDGRSQRKRSGSRDRSGPKGSNLGNLGDAIGGFLADQFAKKNSGKSRY